jgi:hypothetical protein
MYSYKGYIKVDTELVCNGNLVFKSYLGTFNDVNFKIINGQLYITTPYHGNQIACDVANIEFNNQPLGNSDIEVVNNFSNIKSQNRRTCTCNDITLITLLDSSTNRHDERKVKLFLNGSCGKFEGDYFVKNLFYRVALEDPHTGSAVVEIIHKESEEETVLATCLEKHFYINDYNYAFNSTALASVLDSILFTCSKNKSLIS